MFLPGDWAFLRHALLFCRFVNLIINKTATRFPNGTLDVLDLDFSKLTLDEYTSLFATIDQADYCSYTLSTAFLVFNGFAFSFAMATLFLVAIVPVFIRRQHWDAYLARVGAFSMSLTAPSLCGGFPTGRIHCSRGWAGITDQL